MKKKDKKKKRTQGEEVVASRRQMATVTAAALLGAAAFLLVLAGINLHGLTYDEPIYAGFGTRSAQWKVGLFTSLFDGTLRQHVSAEVINRAWYAEIDMQPPFAQTLYGLSNLALKDIAGGLTAPRLPVAIFFALAVAILFWLTEQAFGRPAAFFASLGLVFLPRFFGHAHVSALDMPVSALIIATAALFFAASQQRSWSLYIWSGVLLGLALLTKLNAVFIGGGLLLWTLIFHRVMIVRALIAFFIVTPAVFFCGWPWLWHGTLAHARDYLVFHLQHYPVLVYYLGELHEYAPWHYPFVITAVTVPTVILVLMTAGIFYGASGRKAPEWKKANDSQTSARWMLIIGALCYLLPSAMPLGLDHLLGIFESFEVPKYNGVRLFLPAMVFLMGLAGGGFDLLWGTAVFGLERIKTLGGLGNLRGKVALLLLVGLLLPSVIGLSRVYPYERAYYNALVGGPEGARRRGFETIYWGGVYAAALPALNGLEKRAPTVFVTPAGVTSLLIAYQRGGGLREDIQWATPPPAKEQKEGWPKEALKDVDLVIFQCAQSEFDAVAETLYRSGTPGASSIYLEGIPLLLVFDGEEARRHFR